MAFVTILSGDRFGQRSSSNVPKTFTAARWFNAAAGTPAVGNLCKQDTTAGYNDGVVECIADDVPEYLVESVNSANGTLSCWVLARTFSLVLEAVSAATTDIGKQIRVSDPSVVGPSGHDGHGTVLIGGFTRDRVKAVAKVPGTPTGIGTIVSVTGTGAGALYTVEFHGGWL